MAGSFQKRHQMLVHKLGFQKKLQYRLVEVTLGSVTNPKSDLNNKVIAGKLETARKAKAAFCIPRG